MRGEVDDEDDWFGAFEEGFKAVIAGSEDDFTSAVFGMAIEDAGIELAGLVGMTGAMLLSWMRAAGPEVFALPSTPSIADFSNPTPSSSTDVPLTLDEPGADASTPPALVPGRLEAADTEPDPVPIGAGTCVACLFCLLSAKLADALRPIAELANGETGELPELFSLCSHPELRPITPVEANCS